MGARHGRGEIEMFVRKAGASQKRLGNTALAQSARSYGVGKATKCLSEKRVLAKKDWETLL